MYYEYPNVFQYVLICCYIGVKKGVDCDVVLSPVFADGRVKLPSYGIEFETACGKVKSVRNISDKLLTVKIDRVLYSLTPEKAVLIFD